MWFCVIHIEVDWLARQTVVETNSDDNNNGVFVILIAKTMLFTLIKSGAIITLKCSEIDIWETFPLKSVGHIGCKGK